jgi:hypothetical protein
MNEAAAIFSASEIAAAIGWSKKRVQTALAGYVASGTKEMSGNQCDAWSTGHLPKAIVQELQRIQRVHRYRSFLDVLRDPLREWMPPIPRGQIAQSEWRRAEQLREALAVAMALPEESSIRGRASAAASHHRRAFGHGVSDRQLRILITRTLDRDRGARNFSRLEIYLPDAPRPAAPRVQRGAAGKIDFSTLADDFDTIAVRERPTMEERAFFWRKVTEFHAAQIEAGTREVLFKKWIVAFALAEMPAIAESANAFRRNLDRKLTLAAQDGAEALIDGRKTNSGRRRNLPEWDGEIMRLAKASRAYGGRIAQAFRELYLGTHPSGEQFSQAFRDYYFYNARQNKSAVPAAVLSAVRPMMAATDALAHGPKAARLALPSIHRDWTMLPAGASFTADDVTPNHYTYDWHEEGHYEFEGRRFNVTRNQVLVFCDERTGFVLGFSLCPRPQYSADDICAAVARLCMDRSIGLPTKRFLFERSIWQGKKVKGLVEWAKREEGFLREGIQLGMAHATTPKAKIVERVLGSLQSMMQALPCYIGRNERIDHFERSEAFLKSLKLFGQPLKQEVNPADHMLSAEAMAREIEKTARRFNTEPQNGDRLPGISPEEGWERFRNPAPAKVLPEALRYLLATRESPATVTNEGILLRVGRNKHFYSGSERLGELVGEKVLVRFNPDLPEIITVCHPASDPKALRPFSIPLDKKLPAIGATAADFTAVRSAHKAFAAFGKTIFRAIAPANHLTISRDDFATPEALQRGERIGALHDEHGALVKKRASRAGTINRLAAQAGVAIDPAKARRPDAVAENLQRARELEAAIEREEAEQA